MGGKGRSRRRGVSTDTKRRISAFLSVVLTTAMTLNAPMGALGFGVMEAFASSSDARPATGNDAAKDDAAQTGGGGHGSMEDLGEGWMTAKNAVYQQGQARDVDIYVIAEDNEVAPGNVSTMRLYLKNNTGSTLTDGTLSFTGSRIRKEDGTFTDISGTGVAAEDGTLDDWDAAGAMEGDGGEQYIDEMEAREAEEYAREFGKDEDGQGLTKLTGIRLEPGQLHEVEFEFYTDDSVREGKAYVDFKFQGKTGEGSVRSAEKFYYSIGLPTVNIELLDGEALETGVEHELSIWMTAPSWGDYEIPETEAPLKKIQATTTAGTETKAPTGTQEAPAEAGDEQKAQVEAGEQKPQAGTAGEQGSQTGTAGEQELQTGAAGQQESQTQEAGSPETEADSAKAEAAAEEDTRPVKIIEDEGVPVAEDLTLGRSTLEADMVQASLDTIAPEGAEGQSQAAEKETIAEAVTEPTEETTEEATTTSAEETTAEAATTPAAPVEGATEEATAAPTEGAAAEETSAPAEGAAAEETTTPAEGTAADQAGQIVPAESSADPAQTPEAVVESTLDEDAIKASEEAAAKEAEQAAQMAQALAIKESKVSYTVEVFGTEFRKFRPKKAAEIEDIGWISCLYELAEDARPGVYYGKVTAKGKWNRRSFTTSQGFLFEITGEGTITVKGELDGTKVEVSGPASSFPEAAKLELEVKPLSQEEEEAVQEAIGRKDAPYAAFEMSLLADGETADTKGPVTVKVGNKTIKENTAKIAEAAKVQAAAAEAVQEQTVTAQTAAAEMVQEQTAQAEGVQAAALSDGTKTDDEAAAAEEKDENAAPVTAEEAEKESAAPVNRRKGPGADGKSDTGARLTAEGTLASTAEEKAEKETQETIVADSQEAGLALMKIDTRSVQAEELKSGITEGGELQTDTSEVMAIYAVTGLEEEMAHPAFEASVELEDMKVTVTAEEGILPEGTGLSVVEVTEKIEDALTQKLTEQGDTSVAKVLAYDINLMLDGKKLSNEYWKDDHVTVNFSGKKIEDLSKTADTIAIATLETPTVEVEAAMGDKEEIPMLENVKAEEISWDAAEVTTVYVGGKENVEEVGYQAEHFTTVTLMARNGNDAESIKVIAGQEYRLSGLGGFGDYFDSAECFISDNGSDDWTSVNKNAYVQIKWDFEGNKDYIITATASAEGKYVKLRVPTVDNGGLIFREFVFQVFKPAYYYILKPQYSIEDSTGDSTNYPALWYFAGYGGVANVDKPPTDDNLLTPKNGTEFRFVCGGDPYANHSAHDDQYVYAIYPEISYEGRTYSYSEDGTGETYRVVWHNIPLSNGANCNVAGDNGVDNHYVLQSSTTPNCYHVNGYVVFPERISVIFKVWDPKEWGFVTVSSQSIGSGMSATEPLPTKPASPSDDAGFITEKTVNGKTYYFDTENWYKDAEFTGKTSNGDYTYDALNRADTDEDDVVIFYGRYVNEKPAPQYDLTVHKILSGLEETADDYKTKVQTVEFQLEKWDENDKNAWIQASIEKPNVEGNISYKLEAGKYRLSETKPAEGYKGLEGCIEFEITPVGETLEINYTNKGTSEYWQVDDKTGVLTVTNKANQQSGILLPDTGGPGLLQMNRFGWLLLLIALLMAGTEVQYFGVHRNRVETGEERYPYHEEL